MIGEKIRILRKGKGMTLQTLAESAGVTASYISQLERNLVDPSLSTLRKISRVLGVSMSSFLENEEENTVAILIRDGQGRKLAPGDTISYQYLTPAPSEENHINMEVIRFELSANTWDTEETFFHAAEETTFLLSGKLHFQVENEVYELNPGDSIYIRPNTRHRAFNPGSEPAIGFSFATPVV